MARGTSPTRRAPAVASSGDNDSDADASVARPPRQRRRSESRSRTFLRHLCDDFLDLPWDKVVAALISTLIIVVGCNRMFFIGDEVGKVTLNVQQVKAEADSKHHQLAAEVVKADRTMQLMLKNMEQRLQNLVKEENAAILARLQLEQAARHALDKRLSVLELRMELAGDLVASGGSCDGLVDAATPAIVDAYERTSMQAAEMYSSMSKELETIRARVDSLLTAGLTSHRVHAAGANTSVNHTRAADQAAGQPTELEIQAAGGGGTVDVDHGGGGGVPTTATEGTVQVVLDASADGTVTGEAMALQPDGPALAN